MLCDLCECPFKDGDEVVTEIPGQWLAGEVQQTDHATTRHEECEEF